MQLPVSSIIISINEQTRLMDRYTEGRKMSFILILQIPSEH